MNVKGKYMVTDNKLLDSPCIQCHNFVSKGKSRRVRDIVRYEVLYLSKVLEVQKN